MAGDVVSRVFVGSSEDDTPGYIAAWGMSLDDFFHCDCGEFDGIGYMLTTKDDKDCIVGSCPVCRKQAGVKPGLYPS